MKKLIFLLIILFIGFEIYYYKDNIYEYIILNYIYKEETNIEEINEYKQNYNYNFVQLTDNFKPKNKQDILNILYTGLNNGWSEFSYFCTIEYEECIKDSKSITDNISLVSYLNNFIHPFNNFNTIQISINNLGKVTINVNKLYTEEEITIINQKTNEIYNSIITNEMSDKEKIKTIHDYIINNTVYDKEKANNIGNKTYQPKYKSEKAYGPLIEGFGICGGYSDAMAIFLNKMKIQNYKISSKNHVWNLVNLEGNWYHLDLTWDDPVVNTNENMLLDNYFLIKTEKLEEIDKTQHTYNKEIFKEAK